MDFDYIQSDYVENGINYYIAKMNDGSTVTFSNQLSSKTIDKYVKWKNRNLGPSSYQRSLV